MGDRYVYYRVYNEDGALRVRDPVGYDNTLGRITAHSITPPHNVRNIRHRIAVNEQLPDHYKPDLYLDMDGSPTEDGSHVSLSGDSYPGASPESAIGLVISGAGHNDKKPLNVAGEWAVEEHGGGTTSRGTYMLNMVDDSAFTGHGRETDTFSNSDQTKSYNFSIVDGKIASDGQVTWLCISPDIPGQWRIRAVLTRDEMQMDGVMEAVSGNVVSGSGIYKRVSRN